MKKIVLKLYEFDELSKDSQERIIEREHWNVMEQCMDAYGIDYKKSMKAFEDMTDTRVYNWEVGYERYDFSYEFKYKDPIYEHPTDYHRDIFPENLCGKLLFRYINNNIMPYIIKGKYFSTSGKYIDGKYKYRHKYSRVMFDYGDNCPLTGMCYDYYLLKPIIDYYNAWCTYPDDFSFEDLIGRCYDSFFKSWYEEYEYWADNEDAIRGTRKTGCDLLILGGTNCDESYLDGVFGCLGNEKFYVCQPISLYKTTRNIHERPALYAFKIATEYFRAHGMVPVFENSHCKLMRL